MATYLEHTLTARVSQKIISESQVDADLWCRQLRPTFHPTFSLQLIFDILEEGASDVGNKTRGILTEQPPLYP